MQMSDETPSSLSFMQDLSSRVQNNVWDIDDLINAANKATTNGSSSSSSEDGNFINYMPSITSNSSETMNDFYNDYPNLNMHSQSTLPPSTLPTSPEKIGQPKFNDNNDKFREIKIPKYQVINVNHNIGDNVIKDFKGWKCGICDLVLLLPQDLKRHKEIRHFDNNHGINITINDLNNGEIKNKTAQNIHNNIMIKPKEFKQKSGEDIIGTMTNDSKQIFEKDKNFNGNNNSRRKIKRENNMGQKRVHFNLQNNEIIDDERKYGANYYKSQIGNNQIDLNRHKHKNNVLSVNNQQYQ